MVLGAKTTAHFISEADKKKLYDNPYWHVLLHMPDGLTSEIDDPAFFIAKDGKHDPKAELDATINALLNEERFDDNATACRYPARTFWLKKKLALQDLPEVECSEFEKLMKRIDPRSVTLVFPYAHINSPASMFGHTFLRIDSSLDSKMLSYAINYAASADTKTENGVIFAIKGLLGGYYGKYSLLPYYEKLKEYRDSEQRDIWEYDLDLDHEEVMQMMRHIWEINHTFSWYYFFDENCSYNMLWLIEAAREGIDLRKYFVYQVIPPETVHAVITEGIVKEQKYRPSKRSRLLAYEKALEERSLERVLAVTDQGGDPMQVVIDKNVTLQQKRFILEAASEMTEYRYIENDINKSTYTAQFHTILSARSKLGKGDTLDIPEPDNPMAGHQAIRTTFQSGWREGRPIHFVGFRPAYHSIKDSDVGYLRGTQIEFMSFLGSYSDDAFDVEDATVISIVSIAQRSAFFTPFSWRMKAGWDRKSMEDSCDPVVTIGAGQSWGNERAYWYVMADPFVYAKSSIESGIGTSVGGVWYQYRDWKMNLEATQRWYDTGEAQSRVELSEHWRLSPNMALLLEYEYLDRSVEEQETVKISFDYFF
jgi:hypothetical protein